MDSVLRATVVSVQPVETVHAAVLMTNRVASVALVVKIVHVATLAVSVAVNFKTKL